MTQQFKFGDHVRYKDNENPVFGVVLEEANQGNGLITVQFIDNAEPKLVGSDDLECVPHPDTVRLDWLAKNDCALTEMLCDDDGERLDTPFAVIQKQEEHFELLAAANNIRQAIDQAMRTQAEEAA